MQKKQVNLQKYRVTYKKQDCLMKEVLFLLILYAQNSYLFPGSP